MVRISGRAPKTTSTNANHVVSLGLDIGLGLEGVSHLVANAACSLHSSSAYFVPATALAHVMIGKLRGEDVTVPN